MTITAQVLTLRKLDSRRAYAEIIAPDEVLAIVLPKIADFMEVERPDLFSVYGCVPTMTVCPERGKAILKLPSGNVELKLCTPVAYFMKATPGQRMRIEVETPRAPIDTLLRNTAHIVYGFPEPGEKFPLAAVIVNPDSEAFRIFYARSCLTAAKDALDYTLQSFKGVPVGYFTKSMKLADAWAAPLGMSFVNVAPMVAVRVHFPNYKIINSNILEFGKCDLGYLASLARICAGDTCIEKHTAPLSPWDDDPYKIISLKSVARVRVEALPANRDVGPAHGTEVTINGRRYTLWDGFMKKGLAGGMLVARADFSPARILDAVKACLGTTSSVQIGSLVDPDARVETEDTSTTISDGKISIDLKSFADKALAGVKEFTVRIRAVGSGLLPEPGDARFKLVDNVLVPDFDVKYRKPSIKKTVKLILELPKMALDVAAPRYAEPEEEFSVTAAVRNVGDCVGKFVVCAAGTCKSGMLRPGESISASARQRMPVEDFVEIPATGELTLATGHRVRNEKMARVRMHKVLWMHDGMIEARAGERPLLLKFAASALSVQLSSEAMNRAAEIRLAKLPVPAPAVAIKLELQPHERLVLAKYNAALAISAVASYPISLAVGKTVTARGTRLKWSSGMPGSSLLADAMLKMLEEAG